MTDIKSKDIIGATVESIEEYIECIEKITLKLKDGRKVNIFAQTDDRAEVWIEMERIW